MKNVTINDETTIRVYFDDLCHPEKMTFAVEVNGEPQFLSEHPADMNDLADIQEMSIGDINECDSEYFHLNYYEVRNGDIGCPFDQDDFEKLHK